MSNLTPFLLVFPSFTATITFQPMICCFIWTSACSSLPDDFHENPFLSSSVKFTVKDPLPCAKIQIPLRHGDNHFPAHDLSLHMGIRVVLTHIVLVLRNRFMGCQFLQPEFIVVMKAGFIVINKDRGRNMHGIDKDKPLLDSAILQALVDLRSDIDEGPSGGDVE